MLKATDIEALRYAATQRGGWLPQKGLEAAAKRLHKNDMLKVCGQSVMPPHTLYIITEAGRQALAATK